MRFNARNKNEENLEYESYSKFSSFLFLPHNLKLNLTWNAYAKCLMLFQFVRVIEQFDKKHSG